MADRPLSKEEAPDTARVYERAKPEAESGQGRLDNNKGTPAKTVDRMENAVRNRQEPKQLNAHDSPAGTVKNPQQPDHSMHEEEPTNPDFAPMDIHDKRQKRYPRTEGKSGTP